MPAPSTRRPPRTRRSPQEARELLLAAAEARMAERGPDGVTLRDVAEAVGVTAGLVTHYFGTYAALVRAVLRRQDALTQARIRRELDALDHVPDADVLLRILFEALAEPRRLRLFLWATLRGDLARGATGGLRDLVDSLQAAFRRTLPAADVPARQRIEMVAQLALAALHGWAAGREAWLPGLGLGPATPERDEAFRVALTEVLRQHMAARP